MNKTADVLEALGRRAVVVGSYLQLGNAAKDIDVVIPPRHPEARYHDVLQRIMATFPDFTSEVPGHLFIEAEPVSVEIFEDRGFRPPDPEKATNCLSYRAARRGATQLSCEGVLMFCSSHLGNKRI